MKRQVVTVVLALVGVCGAVGVTPSRSEGAVMLSDVQATDSLGYIYSASAAFGLFDGNDTGKKGTALGFLNSGGLSSEFADIEWTYAGKSEANELNPFTTVNSDATSGTLTFDEAYSGTFAISLKAGDSYAIYVFEDLSNVISITFTTQAFGNGNGKAKELSHASWFIGESTLPSIEPAPPITPEPTSLAIFALGTAVIALGHYRRRPAA